MASISALPNEILEEVLLKLDGKTFARSRRVCQLWKDVIDNLERVSLRPNSVLYDSYYWHHVQRKLAVDSLP